MPRSAAPGLHRPVPERSSPHPIPFPSTPLQKSGFTNTEDRCAVEKRALSECATLAARKPKVTNTINHHLQRIARLMK